MPNAKKIVQILNISVMHKNITVYLHKDGLRFTTNV